VASFHWPAVCRALVQQSGPQFDHVVRVLQSRARAGNSLIGVLGMFARVGATTTALCLAKRATGRGQRVILADGNFRRPCVASLLEAVPTVGWEEFLKHSAPLADAVIHATSDNLDVLALGTRPVQEPQPLVSGLQAAVTAGVLRHAYDLVLLDLGTFFDPASQPTVLELTSNLGVDAVVAVTGPEPADPRDVATIVEHVGRSGCELLGVIENRIAKPKAA
jgi:non-specific protein-tyrosine kinase